MKTFAVLVPSAYRNRMCLLGSGSSKAAALEDSFGPKDSWGNSTRRAIKNADIVEVTEDELRDLEASRS